MTKNTTKLKKSNTTSKNSLKKDVKTKKQAYADYRPLKHLRKSLDRDYTLSKL
ncbi:MAG: hypothetical protein VXV96_10755 [Bdellovibrionota bacterium]|nr:hypothetical protein [Bdellovibrionota bacterium]